MEGGRNTFVLAEDVSSRRIDDNVQPTARSDKCSRYQKGSVGHCTSAENDHSTDSKR